MTGKNKGKVKPPPILDESGLPAGFTVDDLQQILLHAGAPPVIDSFNAKAIAQHVSILIHDRDYPVRLPPHVAEAIKQKDRLESAWLDLAKLLPKAVDAKRGQIAHLLTLGHSGEAQILAELNSDLQNLHNLSTALEDARPAIYWRARRKQGSHPPSSVRDVDAATTIFLRLGWAWEEAGVNKRITKTKRYKIVQLCLERAGMNADVEAIRQAITKRLKKFPEFYEG